MKKNNSQKKMGFSLVELSIVILIIGILVLGITKGAAIMTKTRVNAAKSLTNGSPVAAIPDLTAWFEPSLDSSFNAANAFDGTALTNTNGIAWYDNSPSRNLHAAIGTTAPVYKDSVINSIPALRFEGAAKTLTFNCSSMTGRDYTIFVVEQKRDTTASQRFINLGGTAGTNSFGYGSNTTITGPVLPSTTSATVAGLTANSGPYSPRVVTFLSDSNVASSGRKVFVNGTVGATTGDPATKITITGTSCIIGADAAAGTAPFIGDIAEIILYSRALRADERNDIQNYLSKKYGIKVTTSS